MHPTAHKFEFRMIQYTFYRRHTDRSRRPLNDSQAHAHTSLASRHGVACSGANLGDSVSAHAASSVAHLGDIVAIVGVAQSDGLLVVLAHAGAGNLVGKRPAFGQPPPN